MLNTHFSMYVHKVCIYSLGFGAQVSDLTWVKRNNLNVIWNKLKIHIKTIVKSNLLLSRKYHLPSKNTAHAEMFQITIDQLQ